MKIFYDNYKEYYVKMCSPKNILKNCPQQRNYFLQSQNILNNTVNYGKTGMILAKILCRKYFKITVNYGEAGRIVLHSANLGGGVKSGAFLVIL